MQHIWLESGILVFTNGLTPQHIVALIPFMAFTLELKITLIMNGMTFLICMITKNQSKIKEEFIQPGFMLRLTISKLAHDNQTGFLADWLSTNFNLLFQDVESWNSVSGIFWLKVFREKWRCWRMLCKLVLNRFVQVVVISFSDWFNSVLLYCCMIENCSLLRSYAAL